MTSVCVFRYFWRTMDHGLSCQGTLAPSCSSTTYDKRFINYHQDISCCGHSSLHISAKSWSTTDEVTHHWPGASIASSKSLLKLEALILATAKETSTLKSHIDIRTHQYVYVKKEAWKPSPSQNNSEFKGKIVPIEFEKRRSIGRVIDIIMLNKTLEYQSDWHATGTLHAWKA